MNKFIEKVHWVWGCDQELWSDQDFMRSPRVLNTEKKEKKSIGWLIQKWPQLNQTPMDSS